MHGHGVIAMLEAALRGTAGLWGEIRSRFILRAFDAVLTARPLHASVGVALAGRRSNYRRVHDLVRLTHRTAPGAVVWARGRLLRPQHLPFADREIDVLSFGAGSTVYRLARRPADAADADLVLKVYRNSLGKSSPTLVRQAHALQERYRLVHAWYEGLAVGVPTEYVVLQGPLLGRPAVACVQPYIGSEGEDFFELARTGELATLLHEHPSLRAQLGSFVERTVRVLETEQRCVDLIGRDNLLVVRHGGGAALQLIDYGVLDLRAQRVDAPARAAAAEARVEWLRRAYEETFEGASQGAR